MQKTLQLLVVMLTLALTLAGCSGNSDSAEVPAATEPPTGGPTPLAPGDDDAVGPGLGMSIEEALAGEIEGAVTVTGFIVFDGETVRLCDALAESYPPQCGGSSVVVEGIDINAYPVEEAPDNPTRWTDNAVTVTGLLVDGVLQQQDLEG